MASEVNFDLGIDLSDLGYICSHTLLVSKCPLSQNETHRQYKLLSETSVAPLLAPSRTLGKIASYNAQRTESAMHLKKYIRGKLFRKAICNIALFPDIIS